VTVIATAADDVGLAGVQFPVDGVPVGAEVTTADNGRLFDDLRHDHGRYGSHALTARARDTAGYVVTSAAVPVTVANGTPMGRPAGPFGRLALSLPTPAR
jgi:hypothetical protein